MASQEGTGTSRLAKMQMRFQQKQLEEREIRRMEMTSNKSQLDDSTSLNSSFGHGKVRQMFDERRRGTGIDKSYPLKPIATTRSTSGGKPITTTTATKTLRTTATTTMKKSPLNNGRLNNNTIITTTPTATTPINDNNKKSQNNINGIGDIYGNNNNNNSTNTLLNKHQDNNNLNSFGDTSIDDETFPDNNMGIDNSEVFGSKLPNVGKLATLSLDDKRTTTGLNGNLNKNNNDITNSGIQTKNNIKLKPVLTKKIPSSRITSTPTAQKPLKSNVKTLTNRMASTSLDNMVACSVCNRNFNTDRIEKHEEICKKTAAKQRKIFDASLHRVKGTEAETYVRRVKIGSNKRPVAAQVTASAITTSPNQPNKKPSSWRQKHSEFIEAIRAAKKVQQHLARGGKLSDLPPPPPSENPDYVQCPHCNRRFNEGAATRHIPKCANMLHNKPKPGAKPSIASKSNLTRPQVTKTGLAAGSSHLKR